MSLMIETINDFGVLLKQFGGRALSEELSISKTIYYS